ncbi:hypothetical protein TUM3794_20230 [Shewanella colwelliana]|uniref:Apea-like HEPN domain-containing protein n=1 Tax=Shewanella colwelliana TaxID=23 RepID=A0ABQ4P0L0_SHECO|nr:hypothetical protein [Shewanella colwelliana]GIU40975.1 hypothetical protein TUM3794_20230 [Shewanella colwelliana]
MYKLNREIPVSITLNPDDFTGEDDAFIHMHRHDNKIKELSKIATDNASMVLHAGTSIDRDVGDIISGYFFASNDCSEEEYKRAVLFDELIIESTAMSHNTKRNILFNILNKTSYCSGKEKAKLQADLKRVQEWRNAVAHGSFTIMNKNFEVKLTYQSGGEKVLVLSDEFWVNVEETIEKAEKTLSKILSCILKERGCVQEIGDDPESDKQLESKSELFEKRMNEEFGEGWN